MGHADFPDDARADARAADALGEIPDEVLGKFIDACRADVVAEARVDVETRAQHEVQPGAARHDGELFGLTTETDTTQVDHRPAAQLGEGVEFAHGDVDVIEIEKEPVGVGVLAHPPEVLECGLGFCEESPFRVRRCAEPGRAVAEHVLVRKRDTHCGGIHITQDRAQRRHLSSFD